MNRTIDLNADLGEGVPGEDLILAEVTSANIACGAHAGNDDTMRESLRLARECGVAAGAHPGFADPEHFGRRELPVTPQEAYDLVRGQTLILAVLGVTAGVTLTHVKPHGALYNMAARDPELARAVAQAVRDTGVPALYGLAGSHLITAARAAGLRAVGEAFADRAYRPDGSLAPRGEPGAVLHGEQATAQALSIATRGEVRATTGETIRVDARTLCLHGDGPDAARLARDLREALQAAGVTLAAP